MAAALLDEPEGSLLQTIYENTYRTEPTEVRSRLGTPAAAATVAATLGMPLTAALDLPMQDTRWQQHRVQAILQNVLKERLQGQVYDPVRGSQTTKQLAGALNCISSSR